MQNFLLHFICKQSAVQLKGIVQPKMKILSFTHLVICFQICMTFNFLKKNLRIQVLWKLL